MWHSVLIVTMVLVSMVIQAHTQTLAQQVRTAETKGEAVSKQAAKEVIDSGIFPAEHGFLFRIACSESRYGNDPNTYRKKEGLDYHGGIWQVDRIGYEESQNTVSHGKLKTKYDTIKIKLGIDWPTVPWSDLRKPLYSALGARLYLSTFEPAIPKCLKQQAKYWKDHYNKNGDGTVAEFIERVQACEKADKTSCSDLFKKDKIGENKNFCKGLTPSDTFKEANKCSKLKGLGEMWEEHECTDKATGDSQCLDCFICCCCEPFIGKNGKHQGPLCKDCKPPEYTKEDHEHACPGFKWIHA